MLRVFGNHVFLIVLDRFKIRENLEEMKRVAFYVRVSTADGQTCENQIRQLQEVAERARWKVTAVFRDEGISGAKGRDRRPGLDAMLKAVTRREVDLVAAWSVDRLGRSLPDLINLLGELQGRGVDLFLHQQAVDTATPTGKMLFSMLGVFAEFERSLIRARVMAGLERTRAKGTRLGRPPMPPEKVEVIRGLLAGGSGIREVARQTGAGIATVQRLKRTMVAGSDALSLPN